MKVMSKW